MISSMSPKNSIQHPTKFNKITFTMKLTASPPKTKWLPKQKKHIPFLSRRPRKFLGFKKCYFRECNVLRIQHRRFTGSNPSTKIRWGIQRHGIQPSRNSWLGELQGASECWWAGRMEASIQAGMDRYHHILIKYHDIFVISYKLKSSYPNHHLELSSYIFCQCAMNNYIFYHEMRWRQDRLIARFSS